MTKPLIILYDTEEPGLILLGPSGVIYQQQTGCCSCSQSADEGWYVPFGLGLQEFDKLAYECFHGPPPPESNPAGPLGRLVADKLDKLLSEFSRTAMLRVDRDRLQHSREAWVYVKVISSEPSPVPLDFRAPSIKYQSLTDPSQDSALPTFFGFGCTKAILTWNNCD